MTTADSLRIVVVVNQKGGVGKTTTVMQLGAALSRRHRVLVVDTDRQASTRWWAERAPHPVPFDITSSQSLVLLGRLRDLDAQYDYVLVDTPGGADAGALVDTVLDAADFAIVPLTPEPLAVCPTLRTIGQHIEARGLRYAVLLNRIDMCVPGQLAAWRRLLDTEYGLPRFDACLRQYRSQAEAPAFGDLLTTLPDNRRTRGAIGDITTVARELEAQFAPALAGAW